MGRAPKQSAESQARKRLEQAGVRNSVAHSEEGRGGYFNMIQRVHVAQRVFQLHEIEGKTWVATSKELGVPVRTCQRILQKFREGNRELEDPYGITKSWLNLLGEIMADMAERAEAMRGDPSPSAGNTQIQATRTLMHVGERRHNLLIAMGYLPPRFATWRTSEETIGLIHTFIEIMRERKKELPEGLLEELEQRVESQIVEGSSVEVE
jgi:hypothetical protein